MGQNNALMPLFCMLQAAQDATGFGPHVTKPSEYGTVRLCPGPTEPGINAQCDALHKLQWAAGQGVLTANLLTPGRRKRGALLKSMVKKCWWSMLVVNRNHDAPLMYVAFILRPQGKRDFMGFPHAASRYGLACLRNKCSGKLKGEAATLGGGLAPKPTARRARRAWMGLGGNWGCAAAWPHPILWNSKGMVWAGLLGTLCAVNATLHVRLNGCPNPNTAAC